MLGYKQFGVVGELGSEGAILHCVLLIIFLPLPLAIWLPLVFTGLVDPRFPVVSLWNLFSQAIAGLPKGRQSCGLGWGYRSLIADGGVDRKEDRTLIGQGSIYGFWACWSPWVSQLGTGLPRGRWGCGVGSGVSIYDCRWSVGWKEDGTQIGQVRVYSCWVCWNPSRQGDLGYGYLT